MKRGVRMKIDGMLKEGKTKQLFLTTDPNILQVRYKDTITAFNGKKKANILGKGEMNNRISACFFEYLSSLGINNHFIKIVAPQEQLVRKLTIIPLEVVIRNVSAGSLVKRLDLMEGSKLEKPIVEFYYKKDELGDPLINHDHITILNIASEVQLKEIREIGLKVNDVLTNRLIEQNIVLVDFKLEFGQDETGMIWLADEISPDTCRFWDKKTGEKLDKDCFRYDLGEVKIAYQKIWDGLRGKIGV
jgi:phosphoribosylaminoimidazole-succinocarboxamide synthase